MRRRRTEHPLRRIAFCICLTFIFKTVILLVYNETLIQENLMRVLEQHLDRIGTDEWTRFVAFILADGKKYVGTGRNVDEATSLAEFRRRVGVCMIPWTGHPRPGSIEEALGR